MKRILLFFSAVALLVPTTTLANGTIWNHQAQVTNNTGTEQQNLQVTLGAPAPQSAAGYDVTGSNPYTLTKTNNSLIASGESVDFNWISVFPGSFDTYNPFVSYSWTNAAGAPTGPFLPLHFEVDDAGGGNYDIALRNQRGETVQYDALTVVNGVDTLISNQAGSLTANELKQLVTFKPASTGGFTVRDLGLGVTIASNWTTNGSEVPEPATYMTAGLALLLVAGARFRKSRLG